MKGFTSAGLRRDRLLRWHRQGYSPTTGKKLVKQNLGEECSRQRKRLAQRLKAGVVVASLGKSEEAAEARTE